MAKPIDWHIEPHPPDIPGFEVTPGVDYWYDKDSNLVAVTKHGQEPLDTDPIPPITNINSPDNPINQDPTDPDNATSENHKKDTTVSVATNQRTLPKTHPNMLIKQKIDKAKELHNGHDYIKKLASTISGDGSVNGIVPPVSQMLSSSIKITQTKELQQLQSTIGAINSLMHFTSMDTASVRYFVQLIKNVPGISGVKQLPYFKPLSESIGSSITVLTDASALNDTTWIDNAGKSLGMTTPLSKLNRSKMYPPLLKNIDKAHNDLIKSAELNLSKVYSEYAGFMSQFGSILGLLPHEVASLLGQVTGIVSQVTHEIQGVLGVAQSVTNLAQGTLNQLSTGAGPAGGFINSILGTYSKLVSTAHGLDMLTDIAHLKRVHTQQSQMLNKLTQKFGDQLRMVDSIQPIQGAVQIQKSIFPSNIHGYSTTVNILGDKILHLNYVNDILKAVTNLK